MSLIYRDYQQDLHDRVMCSWANPDVKNILCVSDTGTGKTVIISNIVKALNVSTVVIAHRQELVRQLSETLAKNGVKHKVVATPQIIRFIVKRHIKLFGKSFVDLNSNVLVSGVRTLINRDFDKDGVQLWIIDEAHHVLDANEWGKAVGMFPNAKGLGFTATPLRADGHGLGRHHDGVFDVMLINKKSMAELIIEGHLTPFKIYGPANKINLDNIKTTAAGEFSKTQLKKEVDTVRSEITGDVVAHYQKHAMGLKGVTFVTDCDTGREITRQYNAAGVPAAFIEAKTPDNERAGVIDQFTTGKLLQLVNVDIFGEGFDLPAISVVSMARPTNSYSLFSQQFGRSLRPDPSSGKTHAIIIDHVGNCSRHGLPTQAKEWTLDRRDKRVKGEVDPDEIPLKVCKGCEAYYEAMHNACPYCNHMNVPDDRSMPEFVDGDLTLMDFSDLDELHKQIALINLESNELPPNMVPHSKGPLVVNSVIKRHRETRESQEILRHNIAIWSGEYKLKGLDLQQRYKKFYWLFKIDVLTAQTLNKKDALILNEKVIKSC